MKELDEKEAAEVILDILARAEGPLTTGEVEEETRTLLVSCPDSIAVFLNRLRLKGIVEGELSRGRRGWVWWTKK